MSADFTFEGLVRCLNIGQPLYGIIGSEGGQFVGGHGMTDEAKQLWPLGSMTRNRLRAPASRMRRRVVQQRRDEWGNIEIEGEALADATGKFGTWTLREQGTGP